MVRHMIYEFSRGGSYRKIRHPEMSLYTIWTPLFVSIVMVVVYFLLPVRPVIFGKDGVISSGLSLMSALPGFYFAGLAAVATFGDKNMDKEMPGIAPEVDILVGGRKIPIKLTRRQFLSYLFSYLVIVSFFLCFSIIALNSAVDSMNYIKGIILSYSYGAELLNLLRLLVVSFLSLLLSTLIVTTLHGVYFLTEKMHQP